MSRAKDSAQWTRLTEEASLRRTDPGLAEATRRWDELPVAARMALAREIAEVRGRELTLAYRNVVAVAAGFRARLNERGEEELHPQPCVVFVVKRKWRAGRDEDPAQRLPDRMLTYGPAPRGGETRVRYAAPEAAAGGEAGAAIVTCL